VWSSKEGLGYHGAVHLEENILRDLLSSAYAGQTVQAILDAVECGHLCTVVMSDGSTLSLDSLAQAHEILADRFDWRPS
jgi:hypothetical protein